MNNEYYQSSPSIDDYRNMPPDPGRIEGGIKIQGSFSRKSDHDTPLVSIVTIVFNGEKHIEQTIQSVVNQTYEHIEYIIIDGGSADGTVDLIRKYNDRIAYWMSEPDNGIYDAMNKGIDLASGEWINFMNAGDEFYELDTVTNIFKKNLEELDLIYGHTEVVYNIKLSRIMKAGAPKDLCKKMIFSHQSAFFRTELLNTYKFNCNNKYAADFEVIYTLYIKGYSLYNSGIIVCKYLTGGVSDMQRIRGIYARYDTIRKFRKSIKITIYYFCIIIDQIIKQTVKKLLPASIINMIIKAKYTLINRCSHIG